MFQTLSYFSIWFQTCCLFTSIKPPPPQPPPPPLWCAFSFPSKAFTTHRWFLSSWTIITCEKDFNLVFSRCTALIQLWSWSPMTYCSLLCSILVLLDLSSGCDPEDHSVQIGSSHMCLKGSSLVWLERPPPPPPTCMFFLGVPQGSVLGSLRLTIEVQTLRNIM